MNQGAGGYPSTKHNYGELLGLERGSRGPNCFGRIRPTSL